MTKTTIIALVSFISGVLAMVAMTAFASLIVPEIFPSKSATPKAVTENKEPALVVRKPKEENAKKAQEAVQPVITQKPLTIEERMTALEARVKVLESK